MQELPNLIQIIVFPKRGRRSQLPAARMSVRSKGVSWLTWLALLLLVQRGVMGTRDGWGSKQWSSARSYKVGLQRNWEGQFFRIRGTQEEFWGLLWKSIYRDHRKNFDSSPAQWERNATSNSLTFKPGKNGRVCSGVIVSEWWRRSQDGWGEIRGSPHSFAN